MPRFSDKKTQQYKVSSLTDSPSQEQMPSLRYDHGTDGLVAQVGRISARMHFGGAQMTVGYCAPVVPQNTKQKLS